jgi:hypothetical protein
MVGRSANVADSGSQRNPLFMYLRKSIQSWGSGAGRMQLFTYIFCESGFFKQYCGFLFYQISRIHVGHYSPQPLSVLGLSPTLSPSFLLAQAIFEPDLFLYKYSNILKPIHLKTECSETSAYKIQMPGNYPEESI